MSFVVPLLFSQKVPENLGYSIEFPSAQVIVWNICLLGYLHFSSFLLVSLFFSFKWKITFHQLLRAITYRNNGFRQGGSSSKAGVSLE